MLPGRGYKADVIPSGSRRRCGSPIARSFTKVVSSPCDFSIIGVVPGRIPGTIASLSTLSTGLDTVRLNTFLTVATIFLSEGYKSQIVKGPYRFSS